MTTIFEPRRLGPIDAHPFRARRTDFDYDATPDHFVPGDPHTTHVINTLHLLLPPGERWFCAVYRHALPLSDDADLARDVKAFIGQEATHARAHDLVLDHMTERGIDPSQFMALATGVERLARPRQAPSWLPGHRAVTRWYLRQQLAVIAAIEHFTAVMGWWILSTDDLDRAGVDPEMLALIRWHGAEEVEHRAVAFDAFRAAGGGYVSRAVHMLIVFPAMLAAFAGGTNHLLRKDPNVRRGRRHFSPIRFVRAGQRGLLPSLQTLCGAVPRYLRRDYHPSVEGSTEVAVAYPANARGVTNR